MYFPNFDSEQAMYEDCLSNSIEYVSRFNLSRPRDRYENKLAIEK